MTEIMPVPRKLQITVLPAGSFSALPFLLPVACGGDTLFFSAYSNDVAEKTTEKIKNHDLTSGNDTFIIK